MHLALQSNVAEDIADQIDEGAFGAVTSIRELLDQIPNARQVVIAQAFRCLGARKYYFDRASNAMKFEPDWKTSLEAVKFLTAYQDGLPVQTALNVNLGGSGDGKTDL